MQMTQTIILEHSNKVLDHIRQPVYCDLQAVDQLIAKELFSSVTLIKTIAKHIVKSGGKRLRPLIVLLSAKSFGYQQDTEHHELATIIEFIHTATLLHDDVVDKSALRRGQETANAIWGNQASVLVGDFLYSRAFQILAKRNNIPVMKVLADTTNQLSEGEIMQLMRQRKPETSEAEYHDIIRRKTAQLFSAASQIGAMLGTKDQTMHKAMASFGLHFGLAYQMIDDLLDYTGNPTELGKNIGNDLAEGKVTLPIIYAMQHANPTLAGTARDAIQKGNLKNLDAIWEALKETNACEYTLNCAQHHARLAQSFLDKVPDSPCRQSLKLLTDFILKRGY